MTTDKPKVLAYHINKDNPAHRGVTLEPLVRLSDYEALQAECEKLRALLLQSAPIIHAHAGASHMLEGFRPKRNKWDALAEQIDAAIAKATTGEVQ